MAAFSQRVLSLMVLALLALVASALESHWDQETRDFALEIQNEKRKNEGGCQMNKLVYDMELERQARVWAEGCVFKHEMKPGRGENLAWDSSHKDEKELITGSSQRWFDEKNRYSYGQYSCGSSCHYTQMVWGKTNKIGCWTTRCPNLVHAYRDAWYFVCFYTPKGNWNGEHPYEKSCDTPCRPGQTEEHGLCVGEATGDGSGSGGSGKCEDEQGLCPTWAKNGECKNNPSYMLNHCKKACKVCTPAEGDVCEDEDHDCAEKARNGECQTNRHHMKKSCAKSCHECS